VNQKPPAPQTISFHRTPLREKQKHRTVEFEITATPQVEILFTASAHQKTSTPQNRKSPLMFFSVSVHLYL